MALSELEIISTYKNYLSRTVTGLLPISLDELPKLLRNIRPSKGNMFFPIGTTKDGKYAVAKLFRPSDATRLTIDKDVPVLYDSSLVGSELRPVTTMYSKFSLSFRPDPEHLYRGISASEFQFILNQGYIKSKRGITFCSEIASIALTYGKGTISRAFPGFLERTYLLKISREGLVFSRNKNFAEVEIKRKIPLSNIISLTEIRLATARPMIYYLDRLPFSQDGELFIVNGDDPNRAMTFLCRELSQNEVDNIKRISNEHK